MLAQRLNDLTFKVPSPDGDIMAAQRYGSLLNLAFRSREAYERYNTDSLSHQLSALLCDLARQRTAAYRATCEQAGVTLADTDPSRLDAHRRRYREELDGIAAAGHSPDGTISIASVGRHYFKVVLKPHATDQDPGAFTEEFRGAYQACRSDHGDQLYRLKQKHFPS